MVVLLLLQAIESDNMITNAQQRGTQLMTGLVGLTKKYPIIDIRGRGLMVGVEFGGKDGGYQAEKGTSSVSDTPQHNIIITNTS